MLILTRKLSEKVIITLPDRRTVEVVLVDVDRNKVRLGFVGPDDVLIYREEVQRRIAAEASK